MSAEAPPGRRPREPARSPRRDRSTREQVVGGADVATPGGSSWRRRDDERKGVWSVLSNPRAFGFLQRISGADHVRRTVTDEIVRCRPGDRVLDIGCGTAELIAYLPTGISYLGVDTRVRYITSARARFGHRGTFVVGSAESLAADDSGPRDLVFAGSVLHHLDDAAAHDLLRAAADALVPGGRFVAVDPVFLPHQHPVARTMARLDRGRHVRTVPETRALVDRHLPGASITTRSGLQRFPYDHVVVDARR